MNELRELRRKAKLSANQVVALLLERYPKIDKTCISKAESDMYGLALSRDAMRLLRWKTEGRRTKPEKRVKCHCVSVRFTDAQYSQLQLRLRDSGQSAQAYFVELMEGQP